MLTENACGILELTRKLNSMMRMISHSRYLWSSGRINNESRAGHALNETWNPSRELEAMDYTYLAYRYDIDLPDELLDST